tara:strand:- start:5233 stop:5790 length:558 start_codon:yes stop_codon:yes gene_type:complete
MHDVNANYAYDQPVSERLKGVNLEVVEFTDERGIENLRLIMNNKNGYGQSTSGGWQAEKPLSDILREVIIDGLGDAQADLNSNTANMQLSGELLDVDPELIMGWSEHTISGNISAKIQLRNKSSGELIWQDTFIGNANKKVGNGFGVMMDDALAIWLPLCLDDLVSELLNDEYFLNQVTKQSEGS